MKISVIVPIYNVEKYIDRCLKSIINQTYKDLDIILVDDGSTDNSGKMCDEYSLRDKRIRTYHKLNGGQLSARQYGYQKASGEYVSFIDPDDYIELNTYERLANIVKNNKVDVVCFQTSVLNMDGSKGALSCYNERDIEIDSKELLRYLIYNKVSDSYCDKLYKKGTVSLFDQKDELKKYYYEDRMTIYLYLKSINKAIVIKDKLYHYILREGSTTRAKQTNKHILDLYNAETSKFGFFKDNCKEHINQAYSNYLQECLFTLYLSKDAVNFDNEKKTIVNKIKEITKEYKSVKLSLKNRIAIVLIKINPKLFYIFKTIFDLRYKQ